MDVPSLNYLRVFLNQSIRKFRLKKRKKRSSTRYGNSSSSSKSNSSMTQRYDDIELEKRLDDASSSLTPTAVGGEKVNDVEIMGYFTLQS